MFAIAPQSVSLIVPGADGPMPEIVFRNDGEDVSRSVMEIVLGGDRHILTFNTRGSLVDQQFTEVAHVEDETVAEEFHSDPDPQTGGSAPLIYEKASDDSPKQAGQSDPNIVMPPPNEGVPAQTSPEEAPGDPNAVMPSPVAATEPPPASSPIPLGTPPAP